MTNTLNQGCSDLQNSPFPRNDRAIDGVYCDGESIAKAVQKLDRDIAREYRLSDHFGPRRWFDLIAQVVTYLKDFFFILGQRGEILDCRRRNKKLHKELSALEKKMNAISKFYSDRALLDPKEISDRQRLNNWPKFLASATIWRQLPIFQGQRALIRDAIDLNERKIATAQGLIKCRKLDSKTGSAVHRVSYFEGERERLEAFSDLIPCFIERAASNRKLRRQIEENPGRLSAVIGKINKLEGELMLLLKQYSSEG